MSVHLDRRQFVQQGMTHLSHWPRTSLCLPKNPSASLLQGLRASSIGASGGMLPPQRSQTERWPWASWSLKKRRLRPCISLAACVDCRGEHGSPPTARRSSALTERRPAFLLTTAGLWSGDSHRRVRWTSNPGDGKAGHGMGLTLTSTTVRGVLTRTSGFLKTVASHSLQPYRGCTFGRTLCGVGCYVRHNQWLTRGAEWGSFLEARTNAAEVYRTAWASERRWARRARGRFDVFLSSSTEPFVPQEDRFGITRSVLEAMLEVPPDGDHPNPHASRRAIYGPVRHAGRPLRHAISSLDRE